MQALLISDGNLSFVANHPRPEPQPHSALIRITLAGICSTDLEIVKGYARFSGILGHEFVGLVEQADDSRWLGQRVVGSINIGCHQCPTCHTIGIAHCPQRTVVGIINRPGIFATYTTLPLTNLLPVPASVTDEMAVFTEPLAAALHIREQITIKPTAKIAVVGPGRLGTLIAQVLTLAGGQVTVLGRRPAALTLPQQLGLATNLVEQAPDNAYDIVVEATGNEAGLAHALRLVRPLGTLVMKSTYAGAATVDLTKLVVGELTVIGSRCGPFEPALRLLERGEVDVLSLIDGEYALSDGLAALDFASRPGIRKVLLRP